MSAVAPGWRDEVRGAAFGVALARNAVPVLGVFAFAWNPMHVVAYFLIESWLVLSVRAALEISLDPKYAEPGQGATPAAFLRGLAKQLLVCAAVFAVLVGFYSWFIVAVAVPAADWHAFLESGYREPSFLLALAAMVLSSAFDALAFARRCAGRDAAQLARDDHYVTGMFYRVVLVAASCMGIGMLAKVGLGAGALVLAIALALTFLEGMPRAAQRLFSVPKPPAP